MTLTAGWSRQPLTLSLGLHLGILLLGLIAFFIKNNIFSQTIAIDVVEYPTQAAVVNIPPVKIEEKPKPIEQPRSVFGVTKKSLTVSSEEAVAVKAGNTVAKEQDDLKLDDKDAESLPIPSDEVLVTSMPVLMQEFRIPYPEEAKKANVEGPVVLDLLIDDQGQVRQVQLVRGPGYGLNEAASDALKKFKFRPARIQDKTVAVKIRYTYRFILENR